VERESKECDHSIFRDDMDPISQDY
jgi:hypothetical protein